MTTRTLLRCSAAALVALTAAGCGDEILKKVPGDPELCLVGEGEQLERCSGIEQVIDFGPVLVDGARETRLVLRNVGRAPMVLATAEPAEGTTEHFSLPVRRTELGIGGELPLTVSFAPRDEGDLAATFLLRFNDASTESVLVRVSGRGVKGRCVVEPGELVNFGTVATGDAWTTQVRIRNETTLGWSVNVGAITSDTDPGAFTFEDFVPGEHAVEAGGELAIPVTFRPNHLGQHDAFLTLPAPSMCQPAVLRLQGVGVDQVLTWEPRALDFGFVNPGTRVTRELTFTNAGNLPVRVSDLLLADRTGKFELEAGTPAELEIAAAGGQARVTLAFKPATLGAHTTTLAFKTDAARLPTGNATLRGYGGGPDIDVSPTRLAFGAVGVGTHQLRRVTVANTGSDAPATTEDNLKLRAVWHEWEPATGHGFTAQLDGYPTEGLRAGASADVRVRFAPTGFGVQEAKLRIFSNDPDEPVVEVEVRGEGADVPPCDYEVVPPAVRFGYVENGRYKTLSFHVRNTSQNACIVSTLELGRGSSPEITLPKPIALPATILPGGTLEVPVRLSPKVNAEYQGTVEFAINSLHFPQASVGVSGTSKDGCLLVAPNDIDFGVNKVNCSSRERTFTVYNTCATTVNLSGIDVQAGLSNEFRVTQRPVLPYALTSGSSVEFKAVYRPTDVGTDAGSIAVQTLQLSHPYVVSVSGTGATDAVQTDIFAQDARPKMDILFVVDDSGSMSDKQTSLGANFDAFMKYAQSQGVDFHIAVTSTSVCTSNTCGSSKASNGRFAPEQPLDFPSPAERVITPTSANASQLFSRNVNVGTSGNGDEQALEAAARALSQNRLGNHNAGFLRPDAYLAIVFVTDTYDQSPQTTAYYYNYFLSVVGFRRANELSISGIIPTSAGPTSTCSYDETTASMQSTRLRNIITQSGGLFDNICTPDWSKTLEAIGQRIFGYKTRFFLTNTPDLSPTVEPMRVYVNNVERPATGPQGDVRWTYDSVTNSINFDPLAAPEPGDTLKVVYTVACVP